MENVFYPATEVKCAVDFNRAIIVIVICNGDDDVDDDDNDGDADDDDNNIYKTPCKQKKYLFTECFSSGNEAKPRKQQQQQRIQRRKTNKH